MNLFFKNFVFFLVFLFLFVEIIARIFHISTDAGKTFKNINGNVNYYPNQEGYRDGGEIKWYINELGYPGKNLPKSYENLVLLIGDSYIQNFMNPDSCRQREYLSRLDPKYNFMNVSMAGINLLGEFEYAKPLDSLGSILKIIYVSNNDFLSNIKNKSRFKGSYQVDLETGKIQYPYYKGSKFKDFAYNFKFIYYLYRKNIDLFTSKKMIDDVTNPMEIGRKKDKIFDNEFKEISKLLDFIKETYEWENVLFVFHPYSNMKLIDLTKEKGFRVMKIFKNEKENWKTKNHGHWNCEAHENIANQVLAYIRDNKLLENNSK